MLRICPRTGGFRTAVPSRARTDVALECKNHSLLELQKMRRAPCSVVLSNRGLPHLRKALLAGTWDYDPEPIDPPGKGRTAYCS